MRARGRIICAVTIGIAFCITVSQAQAESPPVSITPPIARKDAKEVAKTLWEICLSKGRQVVLISIDPKEPSHWHCTDRSNGEKFLNDLPPEQFDHEFACQREGYRHLPTGLLREIKYLIEENFKKPNDQTQNIKKNGIRIIGGAFCQDEVNLSDFALPVPLNLDRSVLRFGFRARNMNIAGNLSFAGSYIYENFDISDSNIVGTLFGRDSFMQNIRITKTVVRDTLQFDNSILLNYLILDHFTGRVVDLSSSKLSTLSIRESPIAERLELSNSETNCKYQIEKSELNDVSAINSGFGKTVAPPDGTSALSIFRTWNREYSPPNQKEIFPKKILEVKRVKALYDTPAKCGDPKARFSISDGSARSIQLQNFYWTVPYSENGPAPTYVSLNNIEKIGTLNVDLFPPLKLNARSAKEKDRILELVGTSIGTLIYDFADNRRPYVTSIDQISVDRVYAANPDCLADRDVTRCPTPDPKQVTDWLRKNHAASLQAFGAFIKAFENAGADTTDLKVAKASFEFDQSFSKHQEALANAWKTARETETILRFLSDDGWHVPVDYLAFGAKWLLGFVADFGFRPAQVIWTVLIIVLIFWGVFRGLIRIVAFMPEKKTELRAIGFVFLFDRLIPLYKIREENYKVDAYFQRGSGADARIVRYLGRNIECIPASQARVRFAETCLDFLKAIGIVLAAFLVAAVNALIAR